MKPIKTPKSDVTLTLAGGTEDNELHAQRVLVYDTDLGETEKDARLAFESIWMPDEAEARKLEAGAAVTLRVWAIRTEDGSYTQPPVSIGVTDAVVPERELVDKGTVDFALGQVYGALQEWAVKEGLDRMPEAGTFVDWWIEAMKEAARQKAGIAPASNGAPGSADDASPAAAEDGDDLDPQTFLDEVQQLVGKGTVVDVDKMPGGGGWMLRTKAHGRDVMAQGYDRRTLLARLRKAVNDAAVDSEHMTREDD